VVKKDKNAIFLSLFSGQVQRARKHAKSGGTYSCISSIYGFMMKPFAEHILFCFWKTQTQHFHSKETKQQAKCKR
jgi:hypothetical protein